MKTAHLVNGLKWLLIDRVNAGSGENAFGLSPRARNFVLAGIFGIFALSMLQGYAMQSVAESMGGFSKELEGTRSDPKYVRGNISSAIPARFAAISSKVPTSVVVKAKTAR